MRGGCSISHFTVSHRVSRRTIEVRLGCLHSLSQLPPLFETIEASRAQWRNHLGTRTVATQGGSACILHSLPSACPCQERPPSRLTFATGAQHTIMPSKPSLTRKTIVLLLDSVFPALPGHSISSTITTSTTCYWSKPIRSRAGILLAKKTTKALSGKKDTVLASLDSRNEYHSDWYRPTPVHSGSSTRTGKLRETSLPTCTRYLPIFPAICSISIS